jgi:translation elongation factor P/translation initiation factor 5A
VQILDYHHIKMGRGSAQVRIASNVKKGSTVEKSFPAETAGLAPRSIGVLSSTCATATTSTA